MKKVKGFTLIEILVVLTILGTLIAVLLLIVNPFEAFKKSRDAKRLKDRATIASALSQYLIDNSIVTGCLTNDEGCSSLNLPLGTNSCSNNWLQNNFCTYVPNIPVDPKNGSVVNAITGQIDGVPQYGSLTMFYDAKVGNDNYEVNVRQESKDATSKVLDDGGDSLGWAEAGSVLTLLPTDYVTPSEIPTQVPTITPSPSPTPFPTCPPSLTNGLMGYWKMNEGSGTTVADFSGKGGTLQFISNRPPSWNTNGKFNNALSFNGINNSGAYTPNSSYLNITGTQLSYGGWVYLTSWPSAGSYGTFIQKGGYGQGYRIMINQNGNSTSQISSNGVAWTSPISLNQWHLLFVTYDGSNVKIYLDNQVGSVSYTQPIGDTTGINLDIGGYEYPAIIGNEDEMRVYDRALSSGEVSSLFNGGLGCTTP